jgi:hypothetical protein
MRCGVRSWPKRSKAPVLAQLLSNLAKQWMKLAVELEHAENLRDKLSAQPVLKMR